MFNPLSAPEVTLAVGRVLREAASAEDPRDDYQRAQLLSAYSITRHLAAEQDAGDQLDRWFRGELAAALEGAEVNGVAEPASSIEVARDDGELGEQIAELLGFLRAAGTSEAERLTGRVRQLLRELCDREVTALSPSDA